MPCRSRARGFMQCLQRYSSWKYLIVDVECLNCSRKKHFTTDRGIVFKSRGLNMTAARSRSPRAAHLFRLRESKFCRDRISVPDRARNRPSANDRCSLSRPGLLIYHDKTPRPGARFSFPGNSPLRDFGNLKYGSNNKHP